MRLFQPRRLFTPAEARQSLPLVKKIVADILDISHEIEIMKTILGEEAREHPQIIDKIQCMQDLFNEMESLGCYYKDWSFTVGLVDFPAEIDGELVFLCWRSDEDDLYYYHSIEGGFAGRKRIPAKYFEKTNAG